MWISVSCFNSFYLMCKTCSDYIKSKHKLRGCNKFSKLPFVRYFPKHHISLLRITSIFECLIMGKMCNLYIFRYLIADTHFPHYLCALVVNFYTVKYIFSKSQEHRKQTKPAFSVTSLLLMYIIISSDHLFLRHELLLEETINIYATWTVLWTELLDLSR